MTYLLIDGTNVIHRCYHALAARDPEAVVARDVADMALRMMRGQAEQQAIPPARTIVALDCGGGTFRTLLYPAYKAQRSERPEALQLALDLAVTRLGLLGLRGTMAPGYEADDIIATLATQAVAAGASCRIFSSDKDLLQLCAATVTVVRVGRTINDLAAWTDTEFMAEFGFAPALFADYKALVGDKSDNIPGVPGIGPVAAQALLTQHGDLDAIYRTIYQQLDQGGIKPGTVKRLTAQYDAAHLYRTLTTLVRDVPSVTLDATREVVTA